MHLHEETIRLFEARVIPYILILILVIIFISQSPRFLISINLLFT